MWLAILIFILSVICMAYLDSKKPINYPPGPNWLPILGSMLEIKKLRQKTGYLYKAIAALSDTYGPIVGVRVGKDRQVICCGYNAIKEMLTKEEFDGRPRGPFYETRTWGTRRGLLLTDEEFWQEQRRFMMRHLREFGFGKKTMSELVQDEALQLVRYFETELNKSGNEMGATFAMRDIFSIYVLNTLWYMLAGIRYSHDDTELKALQALLTELFAHIDMVGTLFSQFPFLRYVAPEKSGYKQFVSIHKRVWTFLKAELDNHKESFQPQSPRDIMDVYLDILHSKEKRDSFSESQLLAVCMDMFMAGSETTSKSLGFGFLYLLLYPEVQYKAQEEIDRIVGSERAPNLNDRPNMPYVEALVLESVRMFMGRTFSIPHRALRDTTLQGFNIPKDTMVIANFTGVLMDKEFWGDPEIFRPERFIDKFGKLNIPDQYLPFGFGKHRCMGQALARSNIFVFTASLLQKFNFYVPLNEKPPSTLGVDGVTPSPGKFNALVKYRQN